MLSLTLQPTNKLNGIRNRRHLEPKLKPKKQETMHHFFYKRDFHTKAEFHEFNSIHEIRKSNEKSLFNINYLNIKGIESKKVINKTCSNIRILSF